MIGGKMFELGISIACKQGGTMSVIITNGWNFPNSSIRSYYDELGTSIVILAVSMSAWVF